MEMKSKSMKIRITVKNGIFEVFNINNRNEWVFDSLFTGIPSQNVELNYLLLFYKKNDENRTSGY